MDLVNSSVNFGALQKAKIAKKFRIKRGEAPNCFRDEELFNHKKDFLNSDYAKYDYNDYRVPVNKNGYSYDAVDDTFEQIFDRIG